MNSQFIEGARKYWKYHYSLRSIKRAKATAESVLATKISRADPFYHPLVLAVHVYYGSAFNVSLGKPVQSGNGLVTSEKIPTRKVPLEPLKDLIRPDQEKLHRAILDNRNKAFAHIDAEWGDIHDVQALHLIVRSGKEPHIQGSELVPEPAAMAQIIELCSFLIEKLEYRIAEWEVQNRHTFPMKPGKHRLNLHDPSEPAWTLEPSKRAETSR